jgi:hypothetical protein
MNPILKRGRKPKRLETPPSVNADDIPKPQLEMMAIKIPAQNPEIPLSPMLSSESPLFMMLLKSPFTGLWTTPGSPFTFGQHPSSLDTKDWE